MRIDFRDICGNSTALDLTRDATVLSAIKSLSQKLKLSEHQLLLVSPNENEAFYPSTRSMEEVINENSEYVVFLTTLQTNHITNSDKENDSLQKLISIQNNKKSSRLIPIPIKIIFNTRNIGYKYTLRNQIYRQYSECINEIPDDFQQKVEEIAVFGYELEDIKEALRASDYNVLYAVDYLVRLNSNEQLYFSSDETSIINNIPEKEPEQVNYIPKNKSAFTSSSNNQKSTFSFNHSGFNFSLNYLPKVASDNDNKTSTANNSNKQENAKFTFPSPNINNNEIKNTTSSNESKTSTVNNSNKQENAKFTLFSPNINNNEIKNTTSSNESKISTDNSFNRQENTKLALPIASNNNETKNTAKNTDNKITTDNNSKKQENVKLTLPFASSNNEIKNTTSSNDSKISADNSFNRQENTKFTFLIASNNNETKNAAKNTDNKITTANNSKKQENAKFTLFSPNINNNEIKNTTSNNDSKISTDNSFNRQENTKFFLPIVSNNNETKNTTSNNDGKIIFVSNFASKPSISTNNGWSSIPQNNSMNKKPGTWNHSNKTGGWGSGFPASPSEIKSTSIFADQKQNEEESIKSTDSKDSKQNFNFASSSANDANSSNPTTARQKFKWGEKTADSSVNCGWGKLSTNNNNNNSSNDWNSQPNNSWKILSKGSDAAMNGWGKSCADNSPPVFKFDPKNFSGFGSNKEAAKNEFKFDFTISRPSKSFGDVTSSNNGCSKD